VHLVLSVDNAGARVFLDARAVPPADFGFNPVPRQDDNTGNPAPNAARPNPGTFIPELGGFAGLAAGQAGPRLGGYPSGDRVGRGSNYEGSIAGIVRAAAFSLTKTCVRLRPCAAKPGR
jgi:hypothetical protein